MRHTTIIRTAATTAAAALLTLGPATAALATEETADQGEGTTLIWELSTKLPVPEDPCADYEQQLLEDDPTGSIPPELLISYDEDCEEGNAAGGEGPTDDATDPETGDQDEPGDKEEAGEDEMATDDPEDTDGPGDTEPTPVPTSGTDAPSTSGGGAGDAPDGDAQDPVDATNSSSGTPTSGPSEVEDAVTTAAVGLDAMSAPEGHATPLAAPTPGETRRSPLVLALALGLTGALLVGSGVVAGHTIAARRR